MNREEIERIRRLFARYRAAAQGTPERRHLRRAYERAIAREKERRDERIRSER